MAVVNTNISASIAQSALMKNDRVLGKTMEQLSTGSKINSAADDAAVFSLYVAADDFSAVFRVCCE